MSIHKKQLLLPVLLAMIPVLSCVAAPESSGADTATVDLFADDEMVLIPAGPFIMGSDEKDTSGKTEEFGFIKPLFADEHPQRTVQLDAYLIDKYEVTNEKYKDFVIDRNYWMPEQWKQDGYLLTHDILSIADLETLRRLASETYRLDMDTRKMTKEQLLTEIDKKNRHLDKIPVTGVSWHDADEYCRWRGKRLPSEAEWEKAARGTTGFEYPWGNEWQEGKSNSGGESNWEFGVAPVGSYVEGRSPFGLYDMAGNVMEWVADWYKPYPGNKYVSKDYGEKYKVVRGGGWGGVGHYTISHFSRSAYRFYVKPDSKFNDLGFRCASDIKH